MKHIKLTEEQKSRLLEMCNSLFPQVKWHFWESEKDDEIANDYIGYNQQVVLGEKINPWKDGLSIHWFEFCVIHLFPKLNQWYNSHQLLDVLYQTIGNSKNIEPNQINKFSHPIDQLYEKFKTLS